MPSPQQQKEVLDSLTVADIFKYLTTHRLEDAVLFGRRRSNKEAILNATCVLKVGEGELNQHLSSIEKTYATNA